MASNMSSSGSFYCYNCQSRKESSIGNFKCPTCNMGFFIKIENQSDEETVRQVEQNTSAVQAETNPRRREPTTALQNSDSSDSSASETRSGPNTSSDGFIEELMNFINNRRAAAEASRRSNAPPIRDTRPDPFEDRTVSSFDPDYVDPFIEHRFFIPPWTVEVERDVPHGLSTVQISNLPTVLFCEENFGRDQNSQCAICLENVSIGEEVFRLGCNHPFHKLCSSAWLSRKSSCPVCRNTVFPPSTFNQDSLESRNQANRPLRFVRLQTLLDSSTNHVYQTTPTTAFRSSSTSTYPRISMLPIIDMQRSSQQPTQTPHHDRYHPYRLNHPNTDPFHEIPNLEPSARTISSNNQSVATSSMPQSNLNLNARTNESTTQMNHWEPYSNDDIIVIDSDDDDVDTTNSISNDN